MRTLQSISKSEKEMNIITRLGRGKVQHAATYHPESGSIKLFCDSLKYDSYFPSIVDPTEPSLENVTCRKCLKLIVEGDYLGES